MNSNFTIWKNNLNQLLKKKSNMVSLRFERSSAKAKIQEEIKPRKNIVVITKKEQMNGFIKPQVTTSRRNSLHIMDHLLKLKRRKKSKSTSHTFASIISIQSSANLICKRLK